MWGYIYIYIYIYIYEYDYGTVRQYDERLLYHYLFF